jgi:hypothetical protein
MMRWQRIPTMVAAVFAMISAPAYGELIVEDFESNGGGGFDPAFNHLLYYPGDPGEPGYWDIDFYWGSYVLWLYPATDEITFNLAEGEYAAWGSVMLGDFCGVGCTTAEFIGTLDSVTFSNEFIGEPEYYDTTGLELGEIIIVRLTSYEGLFDDLTVEVLPACPADLNGDGTVNTSDLLILLGCWGLSCGDIDGDGDTDAADLLALLAAWGDCP